MMDVDALDCSKDIDELKELTVLQPLLKVDRVLMASRYERHGARRGGLHRALPEHRPV